MAATPTCARDVVTSMSCILKCTASPTCIQDFQLDVLTISGRQQSPSDRVYDCAMVARCVRREHVDIGCDVTSSQQVITSPLQA